MNVFVNLKSIGRKKKGLEPVAYELPDGIGSLRDLISAIVKKQCAEYNARGTDTMLFDFLTEEQIADKSTVGKVDFGVLYSEAKADPDKATAIALQGFEDGLFRVLAGERELSELDATLTLQEGEILTFIKLTFLAGRLW